jgi:hypothetical protein
MADKKVKIKVDVETEASVAKLKELKKELKSTAATSEDFKRISKEIKNVEDALEEAKSGAKSFADALEEAPGPIGAIAGAFRKLEIATKSFGAAFKAIGIGLIVSLVAGLAAALSKSEDTMKKFEPILIMFEQALNGILGALQPLIDGFIELAMNVMPVLTNVFKVAYSAVTAVFQSLGKLGGAIVKLFKGDFKGAWADAKESVTGFSNNYEAAVERFDQGTKKITKTQKEGLDKQQKDRDEAAEKAKQQREKELDELVNGQKEAFLELLSQREAEEYKVREHYSNLLFLATKYGDDTSQLKLAQQNALDEIDKKYRDIETEKQLKINEEKLKLAEDSRKFQYEQLEQIKKLEDERLDITFRTNQAVAESWTSLGNNIATIFGSLINVFEQGSAMAKAFGIAQVAISAAATIGEIIIKSQSAQMDYNKAIAAGNTTIAIGAANAFIPGMQGLAIAQLASGKAAVAAGIAGKAAVKINSALQVATVGVTSAAQIAAILGAGKSKSASTSSSTGGGGTGVAPSVPTISSIGAPQMQTTGGQNPTTQLAQTINNAQAPLKAYVVSGEISGQMALDRRTSRAATFAGG